MNWDKELEDLKNRVKSAKKRDKVDEDDRVKPTDTFLVMPIEELEAAVEGLYWVLEHSGDKLNSSMRRRILKAIKRMED